MVISILANGDQNLDQYQYF